MHERFRAIVEDINERYEYRTDAELYGKPEWWAELKEVEGSLQGDCEDYCITIANRAIAADVPASSLTLHLVATHRQPDHIVLECEGLYADCNAKGLFSKPPYRFISHRRLDSADWHHS